MPKKLLLLGVLCMALFATAGAANAEYFDYADRVQGELTSANNRLNSGEYYVIHSWAGEPSEVLFLYLHSTAFDPYLALLDPTVEPIVHRDDSAPFRYDALILAELQQDADYYLLVTTAFPGEVGAYRLYVQSGLTAYGTYQTQVGRTGLMVDGGHHADVYLLRGRAGERVEATVSDAAFTETLVMLAPDGTFKVIEGPHASLEYTYPLDGLYALFVIAGEAPGKTGLYEITIRPPVKESAEETALRETLHLIGSLLLEEQYAAALLLLSTLTQEDIERAVQLAPRGMAPGGATLTSGSGDVTYGLTPGEESVAPPTVQPGHIAGQVRDTQGRPLSGALVTLSGTTYTGQSVEMMATTDSNGNYQIRVPDGRYRGSARIDIQFNGRNYRFDGHPVQEGEVDSTSGARIDFTWRLSGLKPNRRPPHYNVDYHGAHIKLWFNFNQWLMNPPLDPPPGGSVVTFTLTPVGPLADGSDGQVLTFERTLAPLQPYGDSLIRWRFTDEDDELIDIPLGVYMMTATLRRPDGRTEPYKLGFSYETASYEPLRIEFEPSMFGGYETVYVYPRD